MDIKTDKFIKENDTHIWREIQSGLGYVYPKNTFWVLLEMEAEENEKLEIEFTKKYAETIRKIYGNKSIPISEIPTPKLNIVLDENNNLKVLNRENQHERQEET